jgi:nitric oxide synthase oxygenase domain/subunit
MKARIIRERNNQYIPEVLMHSFHHFCELSNSIESGELQALATVFKSTKAAPMFNDQMMRYALKYKPKWNALQKQKAWQKAILMRKALVLKRVLFS